MMMAFEKNQINISRIPIIVLTNFIAPYRRSLFESLNSRLDHLKIFVSVPMEKNRQWPAEWGNLDVIAQKTITIPSFWRHPSGFEDRLFVHFPLDTVPVLRRFHPGIVISTEMGFRTVQAVFYKMLYPKTRLIFWEMVSEHTEQGRGIIRGWLRHILIRFADAFWVNGQSGARYIQNLGVDSRKIFKVPYTIDSLPFRELQPLREPGCLRLLLFGQLIERKGILPFLDVLKDWALEHPAVQVELRIAGEGPLREPLSLFDLPPNVELQLLGNIPYQDLPAAYAQGDIFVFPTLADEWGVVVNEAMAAGLPVLGSLYSQAVEEMVEDGVNGWTFHPDNRVEMSSALARALSTPKEGLQAIGRCNREKVEQFSIDVAVERMLQSFSFVSGPRK